MADDLTEAVLRTCQERGLTLATCETDTGGLIGSRITDIPGCSKVWVGGIAPYHNGPKVGALGVDAAVLRDHGSVSEAAALALARRTRALLDADIAVAETGITGPTGGGPDRPVGLVWLAVAGPGDRELAEQQIWDSDREGNKGLTADRALGMVLEALQQAD